MKLYLTSKNKLKSNIANNFIKLYNDNIEYYNIDKKKIKELITIDCNSGIKNDQLYGLKETIYACIDRIDQLNKDDNYISIENGFVKTNGEFWYDIAYIYIKINNEIYTKISHKRYFPKDIYNNTNELVKYFEKRNDTRYKQLLYCIKDIINNIFY